MSEDPPAGVYSDRLEAPERLSEGRGAAPLLLERVSEIACHLGRHHQLEARSVVEGDDQDRLARGGVSRLPAGNGAEIARQLALPEHGPAPAKPVASPDPKKRRAACRFGAGLIRSRPVCGSTSRLEA